LEYAIAPGAIERYNKRGMGKMKKRNRGEDAGRGKDNPYLVFVSHATADEWIAKTLCEKIEAAGAESFRDDRDINVGEDFSRGDPPTD